MNYIYIYLIFSKTGTWLSKGINIFSDAKYVHASISFDNNFTKMYSFGRKNPDNPFSGGFVKESLYSGVYKKNIESECVIYRLKVTEEQFSSLKDEINIFACDRHKYKYNFIGLFGVLINKPIKRKNSYFCTQFVSEVLIKSNIFDLNKSPELVRPEDLYSDGNLELVYEGLVNNYYNYQQTYSAV